MARYKKQDLNAIRAELENKSRIEFLLEQTSKHRRNDQTKGVNKKSKDRGGNNGKKITIKNNDDSSNRAEAKEELNELINSFHIGSPHITIPDQPKLSREQKLIINWDFEGINISREEKNISTFLKNALNTAQNYDIRNLYDPRDYDLTSNPFFSEMQKFSSFQASHGHICQQLAAIGYPPNHVPHLNIYDLGYLLKKHYKENPQKIVLCKRAKFLKMFAACYGEEFLRIETMLGRAEEAQYFLEYINQINTNKTYSDETWEKIQNSVALYNVHHKKNRQFANETDDFSLINDSHNLTLCYANPYHSILHHPQEIDLNTNLVYLGGLHKEFLIIRNPEKERLFLKGVFQQNKSGGRNG